MEQSANSIATPTGRERPSPDRSIPAPPIPSPSDVTQHELRQLQVVLRQRREAERLRKSILERLRAGANVECGPLKVEIEEKQVRQITRTVLEGIWGQEYVQNLRQYLPCTVQRHLKVTDQSVLTEL